jgi:hypothetical protein
MHLRSAVRSVGALPNAPLVGIRQHEQVLTGQKEKGERDHRQEAHRGAVLLLCSDHDVDVFRGGPIELEQMSSADPPLAVHGLYGGRHPM